MNKYINNVEKILNINVDKQFFSIINITLIYNMDIFDENKKLINGPINVVRLEGEINNVKKVVYFFLDYVVDLSKQTECDNIYSKDIQYYLAENFKQLSHNEKKMYDFFLQIRPSNLSYNDVPTSSSIHNTNPRVNYVIEVIRLFNKIFKYDDSSNKVLTSEYFKNVRLHYMDIRDYLENYVAYYLSSVVEGTFRLLSDNTIDYSEFDYYSKLLSDIKNNCQIIYDILSSYQKSKIIPVKKIEVIKVRSNQPHIFDNINYFINKIYNQYQNENVKTVMIDELNDIIKLLLQFIEKCDKLINEYIQSISDIGKRMFRLIKSDFTGDYDYFPDSIYKRNLLTHLYVSSQKLEYNYLHIFVKLTNIFFIRRFLDKSYITNAIVYMNACNSIISMDMLIKVFKFKITHAAYAKISDISKLNDQVIELSVNKLSEVFIPPLLSQCSDVSKFPKEFQ